MVTDKTAYNGSFLSRIFFRRITFIDPEFEYLENGITEKVTIYAKDPKIFAKTLPAGDESFYLN